MSNPRCYTHGHSKGAAKYSKCLFLLSGGIGIPVQDKEKPDIRLYARTG